MNIRNIILAGLVATVIGAPVFAAEKPIIRISGGLSGWTYDRYAHNAADFLRARANVEVLNSAGSKENIENCLNGIADLCFSQGDVLALSDYAAKARQLVLIAEIGKECVHLAVNSANGVRDEDGFQNKRRDGNAPQLVVGPDTSGAAGSWQQLVELEDGYKVTVPVYADHEFEFGMVENGSYDGILFTTKPDNIEHPLFIAVNNSNTVEWVNLDDGNLNNKHPLTGKPIYTFEEHVVAVGTWSNARVTIPCTTTLLVASRNADREVLKTLMRAVRANPDMLTQ